MREILFRGKRVENGEWVEGTYYKQDYFYGDEVEKHIIITSDDALTNDFDLDFYEVIPETLGQFTGLTDKNGNRIFEGDIVRNEKHDCDGVVCFDRIGNDGGIGLNGYFIKEIDIYGDFDDQEIDYDTKEKFYECNRGVELEQLEVIGNIYDNCEFLTAERIEDNEKI
jgi:uncharacterized phage protein (TIGR01671 family)